MSSGAPSKFAISGVEIRSGADLPLPCPVCASEYLHHGTVEVFQRGEDESTVRLVRVAREIWIGEVENARSGNPSGRRDGLRIEHQCEQCNTRLWLNVAQHKGQTFIWWSV